MRAKASSAVARGEGEVMPGETTPELLARLADQPADVVAKELATPVAAA